MATVGCVGSGMGVGCVGSGMGVVVGMHTGQSKESCSISFHSKHSYIIFLVLLCQLSILSLSSSASLLLLSSVLLTLL